MTNYFSEKSFMNENSGYVLSNEQLTNAILNLEERIEELKSQINILKENN